MIVKTAQDLESAGRALQDSPLIALDTETTGLKEHDRPFALIAATKDNVFYLDNRILEDAKIAKLFGDSIVQSELIFQNAKFDMRMIANRWPWEQNGIRTTIRDTGILGRLVCNHHLSYSLKDQAKREGMEKLDIAAKYIKEHKLITKKPYKYSEGFETLQHYDKIPLDIISEYAQTDARVTYDLYETLLPRLDPRSVPVWENECRLISTCYRMERKGVLVNEQYTLDAMEYENGLIREAKHQFLLVTGKVYDGSKTQLLEVFKAAGEIIPKTEKGNDSLTDDVLESFASPAAKYVQKIRHHEKRISTYYSNFLELKDSAGFLHPEMWQYGTTTGRFSYRDPNLQNLSKEEDSVERYVVRGCLMPRPGKVFVSMDYKQQEYRLMLAYAKHWRLIEQVMAGADVHQATADMVGCTRKEAKTLNFAILYGAGVDKIAWMLSISWDAANSLKQKYFARLLEVQVLISQIVNRGKGTGHVYNWLGRKLSVNHRDFCYKLPNYLIQSGGADICKVAMNKCDDLLSTEDAWMCLQVHDALVFEMNEQDMPRLIPQLKQIMIDAFPGMQGMYMDIDVTWSDKSLAERDMKPWIL